MLTDVLAVTGPPAWRRGVYIGLAVILVGLLFWLGRQPFAAGLFPDRWDKVAHSIYYAALAVLLHLGLGGRRPVLAVLLVATIGGLDEWHQSGLPGRSADIADWLTDVLAAAVVVMGMRWASR